MVSTSPDTSYAYFHVRGSFDSDEITRSLGITPSETGREGDPLPNTSVARKSSIWGLRSRVEPTDPLEVHVRDVLDQLDANKGAFAKLSQDFDGTMQLVGYFREIEPGVHFDAELVERIAAYSLAIDCDFYNRR
jgi:hypothetical protein